MSDDERLNTEIRSFSRSQAIDRTEDYLRRGRALAETLSAELRDRWVETHRMGQHRPASFEEFRRRSRSQH